jgi:hypothetical protein
MVNTSVLENSNPVFSDEPVQSKKLEVGEELTYVVKYLIFDLGEIKFKVLEKKKQNGYEYYRTKANIDSYSGIPFVDLHDIYESNYNIDHYSNQFRATQRKDDKIRFTNYLFDYDNNLLRIKKGRLSPYKIELDSTSELNHYMHDGLSIFYYARLNSGRKDSTNIRCLVNEQIHFANMIFNDNDEAVSISAVDYDISCNKLTGSTDFRSIFGLTGKFSGWFSNDDNVVPIIAKLNVIIGEVTVELKSWRKSDWIPPKYN